MLLLKFFLHRKPVIPDNGRLTRYELNAYPFAKVRFFLELAKVFHFFLESHLADIQQTKLSCGEREESPQNNSL